MKTLPTFDKARADLLMEIMPPARFDAICTEEDIPEEINRGTLYADSLTIAYMTVTMAVSEGKPDPLAKREEYSAALERSIRRSIQDANAKVAPIREAMARAKALKGFDA